MKTTVEEIALKLKKLKEFVPAKLDVVSGILYDRGVLLASNSEVTVKTTIEVQNSLIEERFVIPPKAVDLIDTLPNGAIEITSDERQIKIKSSTVNSKFATVPADERYPGEVDTKIENWEPVIPEKSKTLAPNLKRILHCCAVIDCNQPIYTGVRFDIDENGTANLVACDGFRIAITKETAVAQARSMSIAAKDLNKVLSVAAAEGIQVFQTKTRACFVTGEYAVYTKLLSGEFLNYKAAFPKNPVVQMLFDQKSLVSCFKRALICADGTKTAVKIKADKGTDGVATVHFIAKTASSDCDESVAVVESIGGEIDADYNAKYLLDCFKAFGDGQVSFKYFGNRSPAVFDNTELVQLVLPVAKRKS